MVEVQIWTVICWKDCNCNVKYLSLSNSQRENGTIKSFVWSKPNDIHNVSFFKNIVFKCSFSLISCYRNYEGKIFKLDKQRYLPKLLIIKRFKGYRRKSDITLFKSLVTLYGFFFSVKTTFLNKIKIFFKSQNIPSRQEMCSSTRLTDQHGRIQTKNCYLLNKQNINFFD